MLLESFLSNQRGKVADRLIPDERRSGRVLDLGCGEEARFLHMTRFAEKFGMDRLAARHSDGSGITRIDADIETADTLPFEDNYFDVVTMLAVFEHIEPYRLETLVSEIRRILKPGGSYILTTPAVWTDGMLRVMAKLKLIDGVLLAEHKDAYTHAMIARVLQRSGFDQEQMRFGYFELFMNLWAAARK